MGRCSRGLARLEAGKCVVNEGILLELFHKNEHRITPETMCTKEVKLVFSDKESKEIANPHEMRVQVFRTGAS